MELREEIGRKKHLRGKVVGGVKGRDWEEETHEKESGWCPELREEIGRKKHLRGKVVGGVKGRYWEEETHEKESGWWS